MAVVMENHYPLCERMEQTPAGMGQSLFPPPGFVAFVPEHAGSWVPSGHLHAILAITTRGSTSQRAHVGRFKLVVDKFLVNCS